jgi:hypothetical protein
MKLDDIMIIVGITGTILLVTTLYAFPPDSLIEAIKQSGF